MDALKEAAKHLAIYQQQQDTMDKKRVGWKELDSGPVRAREERELSQTYALVSIAESLHELTVQGMTVTANQCAIHKSLEAVGYQLEEIAHRLKERE